MSLHSLTYTDKKKKLMPMSYQLCTVNETEAPEYLENNQLQDWMQRHYLNFSILKTALQYIFLYVLMHK